MFVGFWLERNTCHLLITEQILNATANQGLGFSALTLVWGCCNLSRRADKFIIVIGPRTADKNRNNDHNPSIVLRIEIVKP